MTFKYNGLPSKLQEARRVFKYTPRYRLRKDTQPADANVCRMMRRATYLRGTGHSAHLVWRELIQYLLANPSKELEMQK